MRRALLLWCAFAAAVRGEDIVFFATNTLTVSADFSVNGEALQTVAPEQRLRFNANRGHIIVAQPWAVAEDEAARLFAQASDDDATVQELELRDCSLLPCGNTKQPYALVDPDKGMGSFIRARSPGRDGDL